MKLKSLLKIKKNPFNDWVAKETLSDENITIIEMRHKSDPIYWPIIAIFMKSPKRIIITGDHGNWSWDMLTWEPSIHNLPYENISYLSEKLSSESKQIYKIYDQDEARNDIYTYIKRVNGKYDIPISNKLWELLNEPFYLDNLSEFCEQRNFDDDVCKYLQLIKELLGNCECEQDLISFLRTNSSEFEDYVESDFFESPLWYIGKTYNPQYLYSLLALETASKQLKKKVKKNG